MRATAVLVLTVICASAQTQVDYNTQIKNGPGYLSDATYTVLSQACTAAGSTKILSITKRWLATPTQTLCAVQFLPNGRITMATNAVLTVGGSFDCPVYQQCLDSSASGASASFAASSTVDAWVTWFGADSTGVTEAATQQQAAIDACFLWNGSTQYSKTCNVRWPQGTFKTSTGLKAYGRGHPASTTLGYTGGTYQGSGMFSSVIAWYGAANDTPLTTVGHMVLVSHLQIIDKTATGWLACYDYNGDANIGGSTNSLVQQLYCEGSHYPGDGITMGRGGFQADSLTVVASRIINFDTGVCLHQIATNSQSLEVDGGNIGSCWIGWEGAGATSEAHFSGPNMELNDLDFFGGPAGSSLTVTGERSENMKRVFYSTSGTYYNPTTFTNFVLASNTTTRSATTVTASPGAANIVLSAHSFTFGDSIAIAGAGTAGGILHTQITNMTDVTHVTLSNAIVTGVSGAAVTLDGSVQQYAFIERGNGPYVHTGGYMQTDAGGEIEINSQGTQVFTGIGWKENITNPANNTSHPGCPTGVSWSGLYGNGESGSTNRMNDFIPSQGTNVATYPPTVYLTAKNTSANNVIVGGDVSWCKPNTAFGLIVILRLYDGSATYSLQAGVNTLNYAGNGNESIVKMSNQASNLSTPIVAGSTVVLLYIPSVGWVMVGT